MDPVAAGQAGLQGWRVKVADTVASPISDHSPFSDDQVKAALGAVFFALSSMYVVGTLKRLAGR